MRCSDLGGGPMIAANVAAYLFFSLVLTRAVARATGDRARGGWWS